MVLKAFAAAASIIPSRYYLPIGISILVIAVARALSQGRSTNRERDLHARTILVTGGFTPAGLTLLQQLAQRGAHIIALSPHPINSPRVELLVSLLRSTTNNEQIFAEECDLASPESIRSFCNRFLAGQDQRIDALLFAHEYQHIGPIISRRSRDTLSEDQMRQAGSLATFLIITLLLPALLVAPVERDIRIINVINPFYAAAVPSFSPSGTSAPSASVFLREGNRSLRAVILTRHLQRVLDALPSGSQVPKTDDNTVPVVSIKSQKSNIVAVSVSPGISRPDTIAPLLNADRYSESSFLGFALYLLLQPILRIFTKSSLSALQSVLHVLFLPTPFKSISSKKSATKSPVTNSVLGEDTSPEEVLKPGALYSDCAVVRVAVPPSAEPASNSPSGGLRSGGPQGKDVTEIPDDGELGGEVTGRLVWESFEVALKEWEKMNSPKGKTTPHTPPSVDDA